MPFLNTPIGVALCQCRGNITSTNSTFDDLLGLPSSHIPLDLADLIQDGSDSRRLLPELFQGTPESFQNRMSVRRSHQQIMALDSYERFGREDLAPEFAIVMLEDLSGAALAQQRLQQAEWLQVIGRLDGESPTTSTIC